ncbi:MAG TPA: BtpA/SgcQ family protein [Candidatus Acidoferrum sp.]|nr:BtpA/SgcQ family protein [Candidatus Acidoferrum sp.]
MNRLFGCDKPVIALLHLAALPGDPAYRGDMRAVVEAARRDLAALQEGGVDAVLFSNEFSLPYQSKVDGVVIASMARVIAELLPMLTVPYGVHVIADQPATIELAAAVGASFVRSVFTGVYAGEGGLRAPDIAAIARRKNELGMKALKMYYMINAESDGDLSARPLPQIAKAVIFKCAPDGLCVSGMQAGSGVDSELIASVRKVSGATPVFCNTGCTEHNIAEKLSYADGAFVGTAFKVDGKFENPVDGERVRRFMAAARAAR